MADLTKGQIRSLYGAGAGLGLAAGIWAGRNIKSAFKHMANIEMLKIDAERNRAARDVRYYNEKAATEGWASQEKYRQFEGSQSVANASAGYAGESAGVARLKKDTQAKARQEMRLANRQLQLMSFERLHKAESYAIEQKSIADQLRMKGKSAMLASAVNGLSKGVSFATSMINYHNTFFRDPKVAEQSPAVGENDSGFKFYKEQGVPTYNLEDITGSDPTKSLLQELSDSNFEFFKHTPDMPYSKSFVNPDDAGLSSLLYGRIK